MVRTILDLVGFVNTGSNSRALATEFSYQFTPNAPERGYSFGYSPNASRSRPRTEPRLIAHGPLCVATEWRDRDESCAHRVSSRPHAMCAVALRMSRRSLNGPTRSQKAT